MRPKFVITLVLFAFLVLGACFLLKRQLGNRPAPVPAPEIAAPAPVVSNVVAVAVRPHAPAPVATTNASAPEQRQAAIDAEVDRLQDWSTKDDPASLSKILADLTSPESEIREAAIEATKQFGSTNAIPALKAAADGTQNLEDKIAYLEAANFLSLPDLQIPSKTPEQAAQWRANAAARRQAQQPGTPR